jgi:GST-like protein
MTTPSPTSRPSPGCINLVGFYGAGELVGYADFHHVEAWQERGLARPAVQRGLVIPSKG